MVGVHHAVAFAVLAATFGAAAAGAWAYCRPARAARDFRRICSRSRRRCSWRRSGSGFCSLSHHRAADKLHYLYGTLSLLAVSPRGCMRPQTAAGRLAWFSGATLVAGALAVRAYMTRNMSRFSFRINPFVRGLLILAAIAGVIVVLQLEQTLIALLRDRTRRVHPRDRFHPLPPRRRERREGISLWSQRALMGFYGAAVVAVVDVGVYWYGGAVWLTRPRLCPLCSALCGFAYVAHVARPAQVRRERL